MYNIFNIQFAVNVNLKYAQSKSYRIRSVYMNIYENSLISIL